MPHDFNGVADAFCLEACISPKDPFRGKQGHLRIIGDGPRSVGKFHIAGYAVFSVSLKNIRFAHEFHRSTESIAGSTGLGYFIMESWGMVAYPRMFAGIIALALLGVVVYLVFDILERRVTKWRNVR